MSAFSECLFCFFVDFFFQLLDTNFNEVSLQIGRTPTSRVEDSNHECAITRSDSKETKSHTKLTTLDLFKNRRLLNALLVVWTGWYVNYTILIFQKSCNNNIILYHVNIKVSIFSKKVPHKYFL